MTGLDLRPLAWALIHFSWQGSLVAILLATALRTLPRADARLRYGLSCLALIAMAILPVATALVRGASSSSPPAMTTPATPVDGALIWVVLAWSVGVILVGVHHVRSWFGLRHWVQAHSMPVSGPVLDRFERLTGALRVSRPVRLLASSRVDVPSTVGCLRPVVIVPASLLTGLPAAQLDALLAHELAHVRRWDYAVNLLQIFVETTLFYHPAVWWVSRQIRIERESCCDDVAVDFCADRRAYVEALTTLETMRGTNMAMSANGGSLLTRVRRLLEDGRHEASTGSMGALLAMIVLLAGLTIAVNACDSPTPAEQGDSHEVSAYADAKSAPSTLHFVSEDGQVVELQRPEGMTDAEFKWHIHENWKNLEEAQGTKIHLKEIPEQNSFVVDGEAHEKFVHELVRRGIAKEGEKVQIEFGEGGMSVNGRPVDPKDVVELKEIMHGDGEAVVELKPVD